MAYFLKKTKRGNRVYLSIYESFYSPETKNTRHKSYRKIGFVDKLIEQGIEDPISLYQTEVDQLNFKRNLHNASLTFKQIGYESPIIPIGHIPLIRVYDLLHLDGTVPFVKELLVQLVTNKNIDIDKLKSFGQQSTILFHPTEHHQKIIDCYIQRIPVKNEAAYKLCSYVLYLEIQLQTQFLNNKYSLETIDSFVQSFQAVKINESRYINLFTMCDFIVDLSRAINLPLTNYYLSGKQIKLYSCGM